MTKKFDLTVWELTTITSALSQLGMVSMGPMGAGRIDYRDVYRIGQICDTFLALTPDQEKRLHLEVMPANGLYRIAIPEAISQQEPGEIKSWIEGAWNATAPVEMPTRLFNYMVEKLKGYSGWQTDPMTRRRLPALFEKLGVTIDDDEV